MDQPTATLKPGDSVWCRLQSPEPGGYLVTVTPSGIDGFLPSHDPIDIGRMVPATFVCMNEGRALLTYAFVIGTSARVQVSTASDEENAFAVWADSYPSGNRLRRAVDLVMPPISSTPILLKLEKNAREIFTSLEATEFTGCVKVFCQEKLSRAAVIFHHGRAVGCIYSTKLMVEPYPFESGLKTMLEDISSANADLEMYELPGEIVLSMSALFLGYIDHSGEGLDKPDYAEKVIAQLAATKGTACLSLLEESLAPCALGFIYNGEYKGTYTITERIFAEEKDFLRKLLSKLPDTKLKVYILPSAMTTDSVRFGYSLSSEQFANDESNN